MFRNLVPLMAGLLVAGVRAALNPDRSMPQRPTVEVPPPPPPYVPSEDDRAKLQAMRFAQRVDTTLLWVLWTAGTSALVVVALHACRLDAPALAKTVLVGTAVLGTVLSALGFRTVQRIWDRRRRWAREAFLAERTQAWNAAWTRSWWADRERTTG